MERDFHPPYVSHFGGVWERENGNVSQILYTLGQGNLVALNGEAFFFTLLCDVEGIMNTLITNVSVTDLKPLTPHMLLHPLCTSNLEFEFTENSYNKKYGTKYNT